MGPQGHMGVLEIGDCTYVPFLLLSLNPAIYNLSTFLDQHPQFPPFRGCETAVHLFLSDYRIDRLMDYPWNCLVSRPR